ncbi:MAG: extracellular solute-binding protein, partial [Acidimicrobiia bacterium]
MKRYRWLVLLFVMALVAAACGADGGDTTTPAGGGEETSTTAEGGGEATTTTTAAPSEGGDLAGVDLSLWGWSSSDSENAALTDLVAAFAADTGANAEFQPQAEYDVALQAALASGEPPDVFYIDSSKLPDLADASALAPVPEGALSDPDDIYASLRESFTYGGTWYCPPKDF